jgi:hypothetical protein
MAQGCITENKISTDSMPLQGHYKFHNVHDLVFVPEDAVVVVICSGVEPEVDPLLPAADPIGKHIGLQDVGLARRVSQELEVQLVVVWFGR